MKAITVLTVLINVFNVKVAIRFRIGGHISCLERQFFRSASMHSPVLEPVRITLLSMSLSSLTVYPPLMTSVNTLLDELAIWSNLYKLLVDEIKRINLLQSG